MPGANEPVDVLNPKRHRGDLAACNRIELRGGNRHRDRRIRKVRTVIALLIALTAAPVEPPKNHRLAMAIFFEEAGGLLVLVALAVVLLSGAGVLLRGEHLEMSVTYRLTNSEVDNDKTRERAYLRGPALRLSWRW